MKNLYKFAKDLEEFTGSFIEESNLESTQILADQLRQLLRSGKARMSAVKLNKLFKARNHVDANGRLITVANPADIADKIVVKRNVIMIALTQDENRWIRADAVFGDNILLELGIKYRQDKG